MNPNTLTFYTNPQSRGRIVRWMLEEVGVPYEAVVLDFATTLKGADYHAINPMGKVPAIRHGDTVVTEVAAICAYLADAFPAAGLAPPPLSRERGPYYRWLFFVAGPLEAATSNKALGFIVPPERERMIGYGRYEDVMDALEAVTQGARPYLLGDQFTAADVYVGSHLAYGMQFGTIEACPAFECYCATLAARPARQRAIRIDDALAQ
ncbi:MAG: glutathione S-transferase family protein [Gammaproteobacteria bacterium]|nr:glutathione S-transferase family protein [Acidiferrobacter sp. SPIII_3]MDA8119414.1 glutathione S-transferase family protein [Gammaproteobacteria bacterium]